MRTYILLALVGLAIASIDTNLNNEWNEYSQIERDAFENRNIQDEKFRPNREFRFFYDGQIMNGIPESSKQHSGSRVQAVVVVQMPKAETMKMKLENVRIGRLNRKVMDPRRLAPFQAFEPVQMEEQFKRELERPVKFQYREGMVQDIQFEEQDVAISENVKRGILNLFQVNMKQRNSLENTNQILSNDISPVSDKSRAFRVMEPTVEGECETLYTIVNLPERFDHVSYRDSSEEMNSGEQQQQQRQQRGSSEELEGNMNVTKAINFQNCNQRPRVLYNYRNTAECETCEPTYQQSDKYVKSSSVVRYNIRGNRNEFLIESAKANSQYTVEVYSDDKSLINVYVTQNLHLFKTGEMTKKIQMENAVRSESEMLYNQEWDLLKEEFQMEGKGPIKQLYKKPQSFVQDVSNLIKSLAQNAVQNNEEPISNRALTEFQLLVSALRKATKEELEQIHQKFMHQSSSELNGNEKRMIQDILESAVGSAATEPAVKHLVEKIEKREIRPSTGAAALKQLVNARVVSKKIVKHVQRLCESNTVQEHEQLQRSCVLTLGSLMKAACENRKDELAVDKQQGQQQQQRQQQSNSQRCTISDKNEFVQHLINKMQSAQKSENKILYLKALSNAAIDVSVFELEKIIHSREQRQPNAVRIEAVLALRQLANQMPHKIHKILMPIYMNARESVQLRQVAAYILIASRPERPILDQMAKQIDVEPIRQVALFTQQLMSEVSNSTNPCEQRLARDLTKSLRLTKKVRSGILDTKVMQSTFHNTLRKIGLDITLFDLMSSDSIIPRFVGASLNTNVLGSLSKDRFMAGFRTEGLSKLISQIWTKEGSYELSELLQRHPRSINSYAQQLKKIAERLSISTRDNTEGSPKAYGYWRMNGQETGYMPISKETIQQLIDSDYFDKESWKQALTTGQEKHVSWHHATMLADSEMKIPTAIGLPLVIKQQSPLIVKVEGTVKSEGPLNNLKLKANLKPSISMKIGQSVEVFNPVASTGLRVRAQLKAQLPIVLKANVNMPQRELKIVFEAPTTSKTLLDLETEPVTFTKEQMNHLRVQKHAEERIIPAEEVNRQQKINTQTHALGLKFQIFSKYTPLATQWNQRSLPIAPLSGPNKLIIRSEPSEDNTREVELKIRLAGSRQMSEPLHSKLMVSQWAPESSSQSESSEEVQQEFSSSASRFGEVIVELKTIGSSRPKHYKAEVKATGSLKGRFAKLVAKVSRQSDEPYQLCMNSEVLYPSTPYDMQSVHGKKIAHHTELRWGRTCEENNFVQISSSSERTQQQLEEERENSESYQECKTNGQQSPIACYEYLKQASNLNKHTLRVKYNNVPVSVQNMTTKMLRSLKNQYSAQTDIANIQVRNPANELRVEIRLDAKDHQRTNITIESPRETVRMNDIVLPRMPRLNVKRSFMKSVAESMNENQDQEFNPLCKIQNNYIKTFDGQRYRSELSDCFSVVAKDCSEQQRFVVLAKKQQDDSEKKVVKIITQEEQIVLKKQGSNFKVKVNGQESSVSEESSAELLSEQSDRCQKLGSYIVCRLPEAGLKVYFDGYSTNVKVSPLMQEQLCGLCGHMNNDQSDDFQSPNMEARSDLRRFQREYILKDDECTSELPELNSICQDEQCQYEPKYTDSNEQDSYEIPSQYRHRSQMEPKPVTKTLQKNDKLCFSKTPVPVCEHESYPKQASRQEVEYTCIDESDSQALEWQEVAERSVVQETQSKPTTFTRTEIIPTSCKSDRQQQQRRYQQEW